MRDKMAFCTDRVYKWNSNDQFRGSQSRNHDRQLLTKIVDEITGNLTYCFPFLNR